MVCGKERVWLIKRACGLPAAKEVAVECCVDNNVGEKLMSILLSIIRVFSGHVVDKRAVAVLKIRR
jgi:hypothetical protein